MTPRTAAPRSRPFSLRVTSACSSRTSRMPQPPTHAPHPGPKNVLPACTKDWKCQSGRASMRRGTNHMDTSQHSNPAEIVARLFEIQRMTTGELRAELERLSGEPCRTWNRTYLVRKVSALVQVDLAKDCRAPASVGSSTSRDQEPPS